MYYVRTVLSVLKAYNYNNKSTKRVKYNFQQKTEYTIPVLVRSIRHYTQATASFLLLQMFRVRICPLLTVCEQYQHHRPYTLLPTISFPFAYEDCCLYACGKGRQLLRPKHKTHLRLNVSKLQGLLDVCHLSALTDQYLEQIIKL